MPKLGSVESAKIPGGPQPGDLFADRYRIDELIGEGGMGSVYRATEIETAEECALKVLRPRLGQAFDLIRFKREFRAASRLEHPNCVRAFELGASEEDDPDRAEHDKRCRELMKDFRARRRTSK